MCERPADADKFQSDESEHNREQGKAPQNWEHLRQSLSSGPVAELLFGLSQQHELLQSQQQRLAVVNEEVNKVVWASQMYLGDLIACLKRMENSAGVRADGESKQVPASLPVRLLPLSPLSAVPSSPPLSAALSVAESAESVKLAVPWSSPGEAEQVQDLNEPPSPGSRSISAPACTSPSSHSDTSPSPPASQRDLSEFIGSKQEAILRLQARFGFKSLRGKVSADDVHHALVGLGFEKYSASELNMLLLAMKKHAASLESADALVESNSWVSQGSRNSGMWLSRCLALCRPAGRSHLVDFGQGLPRTKVRFMTFAKLLLAEDTPDHLDTALRDCYYSIKEVMLSGASNRLVAELTQVRFDDLASPLPRADFGIRMEPYVAAAIIMNGIAIGIQTSIEEESGQLWYFINLVFTLFFLGEILVRARVLGSKRFFCGSDLVWNWFDGIIVLVALVDSGFELYTAAFVVGNNQDSSPLTVLRLIRLTRLSRLFRIFRFTFMRELSLMVKGLLAGVKTLACALVLLFFTIYVFAVLCTSMLKPNRVPVIEEQNHFKDVFHSMFTVYRCLNQDCTTTTGEPLTKLLEEAYGWPFVICFSGFSVFVTFGIINLILAIYIESTLSAARLTEDRDKAQRKREALRVAQHTKDLLKKFCMAQRMADLLITPEPVSDQEVSHMLQHATYEDVEDLDLKVARQVFLVALQDPAVQYHMDQLDLPSDRLNLFDILDADGSGSLEVRELIVGLLRVRGDARKSDIVASLLAVRAVQEMIRQLEAKLFNQPVPARSSVLLRSRRSSPPFSLAETLPSEQPFVATFASDIRPVANNLGGSAPIEKAYV